MEPSEIGHLGSIQRIDPDSHILELGRLEPVQDLSSKMVEHFFIESVDQDVGVDFGNVDVALFADHRETRERLKS